VCCGGEVLVAQLVLLLAPGSSDTDPSAARLTLANFS
jgi:hypothetical protein